MNKKLKKPILLALSVLLLAGLAVALFTIFFDQAVLVRKGTLFNFANCNKKLVALTFDDGPSPVWTPLILDELKKTNTLATFFMLGEHVEKYPEVARRVAAEGHEIGNHSYSHHVLFYYKEEELEKEIRKAEASIRAVTGVATKYFRPPKAWLTNDEKKKLKEMGYSVVLWNLNSKDWVTFDDKYIIKFIMHHVRPGDIILFHDSGGAFAAEGGDRHETVLAVFRIIEKLKEKGYECVTITEMLKCQAQ